MEELKEKISEVVEVAEALGLSPEEIKAMFLKHLEEAEEE